MRISALLLALTCLLGCSCAKTFHVSTKQDSTVKVDKEGSLYVIHMEGEIDAQLTMNMVAALQYADKDPDSKLLLIEINSPGGEVNAGLVIAKAIERANTPVACLVDGDAASMAFYILQSCPKRFMTKRSSLMIHGPSLTVKEFGGQQKDWKKLYDQLRALENAMDEHMGKRLSLPMEELKIRLRMGEEIWLNWADAKEMKAVDEVVDDYAQVKKTLGY